MSDDRYDPLPGLTEIPAFLGPQAVAARAAERAAAERRAAQQREATLVAKLRAEQRLVEGTGTAARGLEGSAAITARRALVTDLSDAVHEDALARIRNGEFTRTVERVECERFPRGARGEDPATDLANRIGRYSCLAITADAPRLDTSNPSSIGYPYRARVDFPSGKYTFCKISGRPGEGSLTREILVQVPVACGGDA